MPLFSDCFFCLLWLPEVFSSFAKAGTFFQPWAELIDFLFYPRNFENGPLEPRYFLSWHLKLLPPEIQPRIYWFVDTKNHRQFCYKSSWGFWLFFFYLHTFLLKSVNPNSTESKNHKTLSNFVLIWRTFGCIITWKLNIPFFCHLICYS